MTDHPPVDGKPERPASFDSVEGELGSWLAEYKRLIKKNDALFTRAVRAEAEVEWLREALREGASEIARLEANLTETEEQVALAEAEVERLREALGDLKGEEVEGGVLVGISYRALNQKIDAALGGEKNEGQ